MGGADGELGCSLGWRREEGRETKRRGESERGAGPLSWRRDEDRGCWETPPRRSGSGLALCLHRAAWLGGEENDKGAEVVIEAKVSRSFDEMVEIDYGGDDFHDTTTNVRTRCALAIAKPTPRGY